MSGVWNLAASAMGGDEDEHKNEMHKQDAGALKSFMTIQ